MPLKGGRSRILQVFSSLDKLAFRDIKVLGKSETLLNYRVEYIGEMSAFVQAGNPAISTQAENTRPVCLYSSIRRYLAGFTFR
jgi:hypothetical protein